MNNDINIDLYKRLSDRIFNLIASDGDVCLLINDYLEVNRKSYSLCIIPTDIYRLNLNTIDRLYQEYLNSINRGI